MRRHCLLYAIVSFLSFNTTLILSMLFYSPSSRSHVRRRADHVLPIPALDVEDGEERNNDNWDEVKRRAEADAVG